MAKVVVTTHLNAPADAVWAVIGGFATIDEWHPAIERLDLYKEGNGLMRGLHLVGGGLVIERLEILNEAKYTYSYIITESPMPLRDYFATIRVLEDAHGKRSIVHWTATFVPTAEEHVPVEIVTGVFESGFAALRERFGG